MSTTAMRASRTTAAIDTPTARPTVDDVTASGASANTSSVVAVDAPAEMTDATATDHIQFLR